MNEISAFIINAVVLYGLPVASIVVLIGALGVPIPTTIIVIMLGAFVHENILSVYSSIVVVLISSVCGDLVIFGLGHLGNAWIPHSVTHSRQWMGFEKSFAKRAGLAIFFTRNIVTALAFPASFLAGNVHYPPLRFLFIDILGESVWILIFGSLGYAFSSQSDLIADIATSVTGLIAGVAILAIGGAVVFGYRRQKQQV